MSIEKKIQQLLERATPMAPVQEPVIKQGTSDIDHQGQADVENLGSEHAGAASSANAGAAFPRASDQQGGEKAPVMQGSSELPTPGQNESDDSWKEELRGVFAEANLSEDSIEKVLAICENAVAARVEAEIEAASDTLAETVN